MPVCKRANRCIHLDIFDNLLNANTIKYIEFLQATGFIQVKNLKSNIVNLNLSIEIKKIAW